MQWLRLQIFSLAVVTGNIHDRGGECWQSSGGGICFRNTFSSSNGQYGGSSSLPVTPVTPVTSFCNRLNIYTKSTHYCTCLYFLNGMIYMSIYMYEYIYMHVYLSFFSVGRVVVVAVGYTRACIHLNTTPEDSRQLGPKLPRTETKVG